MLTLAVIKENPEEVVRRLAKKHFDAQELITQVLELDKTRRNSQSELDARLSTLKNLSAQIGRLMKEGQKEEAEKVKAEVAALKEGNTALETAMTDAEKQITDILLTIPNMPCEAVPEGRTAEDNIV